MASVEARVAAGAVREGAEGSDDVAAVGSLVAGVADVEEPGERRLRLLPRVE